MSVRTINIYPARYCCTATTWHLAASRAIFQYSHISRNWVCCVEIAGAVFVRQERGSEIMIYPQVTASEKRVIEVNKDCIWFTSKQRLLAETLRTSLLWAIERFYAHVHDNVYVALLELPAVMERTMKAYDKTPLLDQDHERRLLADYLQVCAKTIRLSLPYTQYIKLAI